MKISEVVTKIMKWNMDTDAIKQHDEGVRRAMLEDGYSIEEIDQILAEEDENPDPGLVSLLKEMQARKN